jgi:uncharacterized protein YqgC (DUF456 family)
MTLVNIVVALLMLIGLIGAVVPVLPGSPLIVAGALLYAIATDFTPVGVGRLLTLTALAVAGALLSHVAGVVGVRRAGGSRWAVVGALVGVVVGIFTAPVGLLVAPVAGAIAGEVLRTRELGGSVRAGVGALLGLVAGAVTHAVIAVTMVALFIWWVWRG